MLKEYDLAGEYLRAIAAIGTVGESHATQKEMDAEYAIQRNISKALDAELKAAGFKKSGGRMRRGGIGIGRLYAANATVIALVFVLNTRTAYALESADDAAGLVAML